MEIVVFGAGSLGSLLGGLLAQRHTVTLVGRDPHVSAIQDGGLQVEGAFDHHVTPTATTDGSELSADLALVTVKAFDTREAATTLATGEYEVVCSLQNGLGNEALLADHLDATVLAGTATYGARLREPGVVECTGIGEVVLGSRTGGTSDTAKRIGDAFTMADIETTVATDMPRRLWRKLAVNAGINATTALASVPNGALTDGPAKSVASAAARETARVAQAVGVDLSEAAAVDAVESVAEATAANRSSMLQDVDAGRRTEIAAINGAVVDRGRTHDVATPVNETLTALLEAWTNENTSDR